MRKTKLSYNLKKLLIIILFSFLGINSAFAQTPTKADLVQASQTWKCLRGNIPTYTFTTGSTPSISQPVHGEGFPNGKEVYLVACAPNSQGGMCTSGDVKVDEHLFKTNNTTKIPVKFKEGPTHTSSYGKVDATAIISGTQSGSGRYVFYGIVENIEKMIVSGDEKSQQQETIINFEDTEENCVSISWANVNPPPASTNNPQPTGRNRGDPFGIVFDSRSLEPIKGAVVTIYDSNKKPLQLLGLTNPQTTKEDGLFNFLVPEGTYYLNVNPPAGYTFSANPNLHPNAELVYLSNNGKSTIYKPNEPIDERIDTAEERKQGFANPERRDIPLDPGNNTPVNNQPVSINYLTQRIGQNTQVSGKVSLPYTLVKAVQGSKVVAETYANQNGFYQLKIVNSDLVADEKINLVLEKTSLTSDNLRQLIEKIGTDSLSKLWQRVLSYLIAKVQGVINYGIVNAQTATTIAIDPILSHIEGYAYDSSGKIVPNATVNIILQNSKQPIYSTRANHSGYFKVASKYLPPIPYSIEIVSPTGLKTTKTTTSFAKENKEYLTKNNIQLTTNDKTVATKTNNNTTGVKPTAPVSGKTQNLTTSNNAVNSLSNTANTTNTTNNPQVLDKQQSMTVIYFVVILVLILVLVGVGVWFFLNRKKEEVLPSQ
jgi:hypothetical protein